MANRLSTIEVVAIAIIILSVAVLAFVGFAIWTDPPGPWGRAALAPFFFLPAHRRAGWVLRLQPRRRRSAAV